MLATPHGTEFRQCIPPEFNQSGPLLSTSGPGVVHLIH
jgi:hypothetical protein